MAPAPLPQSCLGVWQIRNSCVCTLPCLWLSVGFSFSACGSFSQLIFPFYCLLFCCFSCCLSLHFLTFLTLLSWFFTRSFCLVFPSWSLCQCWGRSGQKYPFSSFVPAVLSGELFFPCSLSVSSKNPPARKVIWGKQSRPFTGEDAAAPWLRAVLEGPAGAVLGGVFSTGQLC